jgi:hypothetical protein
VASDVLVSQCGPVAAIRNALLNLHWTLEDLATIRAASGMQLSLRGMSLAALQRCIATEYDSLRHAPLHARWAMHPQHIGFVLDPAVYGVLLRGRRTPLSVKTAFLQWL